MVPTCYAPTDPITIWPVVPGKPGSVDPLTAMGTDDPPPADPIDRETFETELAALVEHAREAGVDIEGAYDCRAPQTDHPDYTVEISALTPRTNRHRR